MNKNTWRAAGFLFFSGMCALIYQTAWLRYFRLIFGASTFATGAVLAIFMGGLGAGSAILGRRADRSPYPLAFYGLLEIGIAISAALTPVLLWLTRTIYLAVGGSVTLGLAFATIVRILLSIIVLGVPTFLMGGTLPAAARAVETSDDQGRKRLSLLYGLNTIGAVTGALLGTFLLLERFGNLQTLVGAAVLNAIVGVIARIVGQRERKNDTVAGEETFQNAAMPPRVVLAASAIVGFAFLLMELVWYRMLSPLLGGTTFMFGLILAVALAGIGLGGAAYALRRGDRNATAGGFALTCTLEALAIIVPFALGDRLAVLANALRPLGALGFSGHVFGWTLLTLIVVFPAAFISGIQFPLLISLLGRGRDGVGRDVGLAYAWNTGGAIAGSLLGGFGLLPLLSAPGCWRLVAVVLALLGLLAIVFAWRERRLPAVVISAAAAIAAFACLAALGPTALWRHSGIGAARAPKLTSKNEVIDWMLTARRTLYMEADGRESSVALTDPDDLGLIVNGKSDGSARNDAGTQVMSGMIAALLHPQPKRAMVVGLGTGTSAGWLGVVPTMERVDVVELEPKIVDFAEEYAPVTHDVLHNEKVHVTVADAREILLASREKYDIIFSEPSNPYRAGIASLFTREFYQAANQRLQPGGMFVQWVQMYAVDARTIQTIYATIGEVFPHVETWWTTPSDVVLVATAEPLTYDVDAIRKRLTQEPYRSAAHHAWRAESAEGVLAHYVASEKTAELIGQQTADRNTDNRPLIEFGFARTLEATAFGTKDILDAAQRTGGARPQRVRGNIDWSVVDANRASAVFLPSNDPRHKFAETYASDVPGALAVWKAAPFQPVNSFETAMLAHTLATAGDEQAAPYIEQLRAWNATEADAILGILRYAQGRNAEAAQLLVASLTAYRKDPWPLHSVMETAIAACTQLAKEPSLAASVLPVLAQPYVTHEMEEFRRLAYVTAAAHSQGCGVTTLRALQDLEPNIPWRAQVLQLRAQCYAAANLGERAAQANEDLQLFVKNESAPLVR